MRWLLFIWQAGSKKAALTTQAAETFFKVECLRAPTTVRTVTVAVIPITPQPPSAGRAVTMHTSTINNNNNNSSSSSNSSDNSNSNTNSSSNDNNMGFPRGKEGVCSPERWPD